jgi:phosphoribosylformimino-5-aminoimidazole carboxamide ribotide isomerase
LIPIRLIPVLDVMAGRAVRAVGGDRAHYRPLRTRLHTNSDPLGVARGFRDMLGFRELYLADLDAIAGSAPSRSLYEAIGSLGLELWVDAGVRDLTSLGPLLAADVATIVVGLETLRGPVALAAICAEVAPVRLVFSLDLREGRPVFAGRESRQGWGTSDPFDLACSVVELGIYRLLLLDLAQVGTGRGTDTLPLLARLRAALPTIEMTAGGGIARRDEVDALARAGVSAVLIGSALHDGLIGPEFLP